MHITIDIYNPCRDEKETYYFSLQGRLEGWEHRIGILKGREIVFPNKPYKSWYECLKEPPPIIPFEVSEKLKDRLNRLSILN